ncbi:MAG: hypothetical protein V4611_00885 [Patescibacteria group bacterium]
MANKQKKKRNKPYRGVDAAMDRPVVTRISAVHRNPVNQWWFDHKRIAKPVLIVAAIVLVIAWLIFELVRISTGA